MRSLLRGCSARAALRAPPSASSRRRAAPPRAATATPAETAAVHGSAPRLPAPGQLRAVLFDIDGTLTHSDGLHFAVFRDFLRELGYNDGAPIDEAFFFARISGRHNPDIWADLFPGKSVAEHHTLSEEKEARFRALAATALAPLPGLLAFTAALARRGIRRAAVTNAPRANAEMMLSGLGLTSFFEHLVIGAECARAKPHPEPYLEGMRLLGVAASDCCAFEDSPSGMAAAVAAGLPTFGLLTSQSEDALTRAGAVACVRDFRDAALWRVLGEAPPAEA